MLLDNKLNITDQIALAKAEEKISKQKAKQLFDSDDIAQVEVGTFAGLAFIHTYLFADIYPFAGQLRTVNIAKGNFGFARVMYQKHRWHTSTACHKATLTPSLKNTSK